MRRVGLLGWPLSHSVSPTMQNAAFAALDLPWRYELLETRAADLPDVLARFRQEAWVGANVTIPHKARIIALLDEIDPLAREIGAVNTILHAGQHLIGYNTDVNGFLADLSSHGFNIDGSKALILGSGGAARAVSAGLLTRKARIQFITPELDEAHRLVKDLSIPSAADPLVLPWAESSFSSGRLDCGLVVNATPVGMAPGVEDCPWPENVPLPEGAFVYDLVYNPAETRLMQRARAAGLPACGGLGMLVEQGALAFELWTGKSAPREVMKATAQAALEMSRA